MDFNELIEKRHSIRNYKDESIPQEVIEKILKQASLAPTSRNKKPCKMITVTDREKLVLLSKAKKSGSQMLENAGAAIIVTGDETVSDVWVEDCSIAMTYLHLAATDAGLGSCWIQIRNRQTAQDTSSADYIKKLINIEEKYQVLAVLSLGIKEV